MTPATPPPTAIESATVEEYIDRLIHDWSKTLTALGFTLVPLFFVLDVFMMPRELLTRFAVYRLLCTVVVIGQHFVIRATKPRGASMLHGYFFSIVVGFMIALMTTDLGGFNSSYYAGLNLVLVAVNLLLPWTALHSAINSAITIGMYVALNLLIPQAEPISSAMVLNNLYFLCAMAVVAVSINHVKHKLIVQEFHLRADLKAARDALWGEMAVAKRIQTSLLPKMHQVNGYQIAAAMRPADEVGGDYYDVIETPHGETWLAIGDVSGHGVESGLIMMMTQTSISTAISRASGQSPSDVLSGVNTVLKTNISRLGVDRYVTCMAVQLLPDSIRYAGKHQDVLVYRARTGTIEQFSTDGVWLGVVDDISGLLGDDAKPVEEGDVLLWFTDGVTEAMNARRELFGEDRLQKALARTARLGVNQIVQAVIDEVYGFMQKQRDDVTVVVAKRVPASASVSSAIAV